MNKLQIKYFKAFENEMSISLEGKNLLIYGENGAGKSSLYEAIKVVFFKPRLEQQIQTATTPEEQEQFENDFWNKYNNNKNNRKFEILVDDANYLDYPINNYQVFLISIEEITTDNKFYLSELLNKCFFNISDIDWFCNKFYSDIEIEINKLLTSFKESIQIDIDAEDNYAIRITDIDRAIDTKSELKKYFNESKLNLIVLLLLFNSIRCFDDSSKKRVLVLDDFITSLDIANRTFLMRYVLEEFQEFQTIILTHNVSFYNLITYLINDIFKQNENWSFGNMYEIDNVNKFYQKQTIEKVKDIRSYYTDYPQNIIELGNKIRKKIEVLLYEYSKLFMIGSVEESKKILERIENRKQIYINNINNKYKDASDLVDTIQGILDEGNEHNLKNRLNEKIAGYKQCDFSNLQYILEKLKLYQKVTMHPMSHGSLGQNTFTTKEIQESLDLLEKLEKYLIALVDKNVSEA